MTREEEIRTAVDTIVPILPSNNGRTYEQALIAYSVEAGIKWADENPKSPWISIKVDLPCNHNELICSKEISEGTETFDVFAMNEYGDIWMITWFTKTANGDGMILSQTFGWFHQSCQNNRGNCLMERELGDEFEVGDVVLRVVEASNRFSCDGCYFLECDRTACEFQNCLKCEREDNKSVKFVKVYD